MQTVTAADYYASMPWIDRPDADIDAYVRRLPPEERDWAKHYLEAWRRDGIIILENAVDELTTDALVADIDHLVRHPAEYNLPDLLPELPSFIRRVCSGYAPMWGVLRTRSV